ncbi:hypothetical protein ACNFR6_33695, partial [Streptomyces sp. ECR3]
MTGGVHLTRYGLTGYERATGYGVAGLAGGGLSRWDVPRDGLPRRRLCGGLPRRDAVNPGRPGSSLDTGCLSTLHLTTRDGERLPGSALPRHAGGLLHTLHTLHADGRGRGVGSGGSGRAGYRHCLPRSAGNRGPQPLCARHPRRTRRTRRAGLSRHLSGRGPGCARRPPAPRGRLHRMRLRRGVVPVLIVGDGVMAAVVRAQGRRRGRRGVLRAAVGLGGRQREDGPGALLRGGGGPLGRTREGAPATTGRAGGTG